MRTPSTSILLVSMLLLAVPAGAQRPQPEQPDPPPNIAEPPATDIDEPRTSAEPITLSGCLQRGEDGDSFVLTRTASTGVAAPGDDPGAATPRSGRRPGTEGSAGRSPAAEAPALSTYRLVMADRTVELADHVGHQVQVRGRLQVSPGDLTTSTGRAGGNDQTGLGTDLPQAPDPPPPAGDRQEPAPGTPILTTLEVMSLQMIDDTCRDVTRP